MKKKHIEKILIFVVIIFIASLFIRQVQYLIGEYQKEVGFDVHKKSKNRISEELDKLNKKIKGLASFQENEQATNTFTDLEDFPKSEVKLGNKQIKVAIADEPSLKRQGLKKIEELSSIDGMLFVYPESTIGAFWMKDTLIPLKIGFYSSQGELVEEQDMKPCKQNNCKIFLPEHEFRYALEIPLDSKIKLGSKLSVPASILNTFSE